MEEKYEGFSLIEMLMTISIISLLVVLVGVTLTTLFRVSSIAQIKDNTRNSVNFIIELTNRSLSNSNLGDVYLYDSSEVRVYDPTANNVVTLYPEELPNVYLGKIDPNTPGNEVQIRSSGYNRWTCIGFFKDINDTNKGYVLKTSVSSMSDHSSCFASTNNYSILLNNEDVDINTYTIEYMQMFEGADTIDQNLFIVNVAGEPLIWPYAEKTRFNSEVVRQITVATQGLTWF